MNKVELSEKLKAHFGDKLVSIEVKDMVTVECEREQLLSICRELKEHADFKFEELMDVCGVDYQDYGLSHWRTEETVNSGYHRASNIDEKIRVNAWDKPRFGVVYHLLSITHNHRLRIKVFAAEEPQVDSVIDIWPAANWFEREAFDLFGIVFEGHPDLRRLLTDYGFKGHPFRKDFPLIGEVELRYDAAQQRCVYEPVSIVQRVLVPKVIRDDSRYLHTENEEGNPNA